MATLKDIAKSAGVSESTVSKVLNGYSEIPFATKDRVLSIAKHMNYFPNKSAVELSKGKRRYIGLIVRNFSLDPGIGEYTYRLISGIHNQASLVDYELVVYTTHQISDKNLSYVDFCNYHSLLGAIVHGLDKDDPYLLELQNSKTPCVLIDIERQGINTAFISTDNVKAAEAVADLFCQSGHKKFCHVTGSEGADVTSTRIAGFNKGIVKNGLPAESIINIRGDFIEDTAYQKVKEALTNHPDITAIFASSDTMALGAYKAVKEAGLSLGENFSLIGFDGLYTLEYISPAIGTVYQDFYSIGKLAADTLLKIADNKHYSPKNYVDYKLLPRESVNTVT